MTKESSVKINAVIKREKDKIDKKDEGNVVYKVNCNDCDATYVDESKRGIRVRVMTEHKRDSKKAQKETPFFKHISATNHRIDCDGADILDIEQHYYTAVHKKNLNICILCNFEILKETRFDLFYKYNDG